jgi:LysM repeat protein
MKITIHILFVLTVFRAAASEKTISRSEYISAWKMVAIEQMNLHGIPASITLAQGILESGNGNSKLAKEGNNHFGIKCHGWEGDKMYQDDDAKNECFRVYKNAKESYLDHSSFLKKHQRYGFLFNYKSTDYKNWAKGLKDAGYATSSTYAEALIKLIEDEKLNQYDSQRVSSPLVSTQNTFVFQAHQQNINPNGVRYVVAKKGDTFFKVSQEFGISTTLLRRYNNFHPDKEFLVPGDIIYLQPKSWKSKTDKQMVLKEKKTLREISQEKGIRLKTLLRKNNSTTPDQHLPKGTKIFLK